MTKDLNLTTSAAPAVVLGAQRYPLVFSIAGMKEWAEHKGQTFEELLKSGWAVEGLTGDDLAVLLRIALTGGEHRRRLFATDSPRDITDALVEQIMGLSHPTELITILVSIWNTPPVSPPDPQFPESAPPGE